VSGEGGSVLWSGRGAVLALPVEIDVTNADAIGADLLSALDQGAVLLVADMSKTTFCDSAGVSALVRTFRQAVAGSSALRLVVGTPAVHRVLSLTGVDRLVEVFPSVAACLAGPYAPVSRGARPGQQENATAKADTDGGGGA
jgi:anti-sigma B factor antagonist